MEPAPSSFLTGLADFLCDQRESIMHRWLQAAHGNADMQSPAHLDTGQLSNHLPDLLGDLAHTLRTVGPDPARTEARQNARVHGRYRWQQDYRLDELLRELNIIRRMVLHCGVEAFVGEQPSADQAEVHHAYDLVERFFEDTAIGSVEQFVAEQQERLRQANEQLEQNSGALTTLNEQLNQADATRLLLLRTVSHDLRNILNALSSAVSVLGLEVDEAERLLMLGVCHRNFADMGALLKELLDYSMVLSNPSLEVEEFSPALLCEELSSGFRPMAQTHGLTFKAVCDPALASVATDRRKLKQVATNLLTNAVKYCKPGQEAGAGSGCVTLSCTGQDDAHWRLTVEDEGIGIAPEDCTR
ncbi:MAG: sensor histidine kinase, partial [Rhodospirillales bacterium]|nr:sensor histidine kinase [Acetobacter sp.]